MRFFPLDLSDAALVALALAAEHHARPMADQVRLYVEAGLRQDGYLPPRRRQHLEQPAESAEADKR